MNPMHPSSRSIRLAVSVVLLLVSFAAGAARAETSAQPPRTTVELEQLVAPIALYPDPLLSQILMASTYPLEVVSAARWSQSNLSLRDDALQTAMLQLPWDPSVKALTAVPQVLQMMNDKLDWTQSLGDAFLAQQGELLDAVQRLRARADANGQLKSTPEQKVTKIARKPSPKGSASRGTAAAPPDAYTIEPAVADQYSVPIYDPALVYGAWPYADHPPYSWYPTGYYAGAAFTFATAAVVGTAIWGSVNWFNNRVSINPLRYNQFNRTNIGNGNWVHNPAHRGAVPYPDANVANRFGQRQNTAAREQFRNRTNAGQGNARPKQTGNAGRGNAGRNQAGNVRPKQGNAKTANRSNRTAGNRQGAGNRQASNRSAGRGGAGRNASPRVSAGRNFGGGGRSFAGGRGGGGRGGGGRRSDIRLKHDIVLLGHLSNGLGFYRFSYNGSDQAYVGVIAQEVRSAIPAAVTRGSDGYLRVFYNKLGLKLQTYRDWTAAGGLLPVAVDGTTH